MWLDVLNVTNRNCFQLNKLVHKLFFLQISVVESIKSIERTIFRAAFLFGAHYYT